MKIGNFGTGRTYKYRYTSSNSNSNSNSNTNNSSSSSGQRSKFTYKDRKACSVIIFVIFLGTIAYTIYAEYKMQQRIKAFSEIENRVSKHIPPKQQGIDYLLEYQISGQLVHLNDVKIKSKGLYDKEFDFYFDKLAMKRIVQFCQWEEYRHERRYAVGKDSHNNTIYEVEVSYTYHLGWHNRLINSFLFDSAVSYHNPDRDPIKPEILYAQVSAGEARSINFDINDLEIPKNLGFYRYLIPYNGNVGDYAFRHCFTKTSDNGRWAYSEYQDTYGMLKQGAGYIFEGVIDTGIKGTCTPGDIRVGWDIMDVPETMSMIGMYQNGQLVPYRTSNGLSLLLGEVGSASSQQILEHYSKSDQQYAFYRRLITGFLGVVQIIVFVTLVGNGKKQQQQQQQQNAKDM